MSNPAAQPVAQEAINRELWQEGQYVADYAHRTLVPVEVTLLLRYRDCLRGRVLEAGCGAGRILGYLTTLGGEVHGVDISPAMVERCRRDYPKAQVHHGELGRLQEVVSGPFDAILAMDNVLDVFDDADRRRVLEEIRLLLAPEGVLIFSSHNLDHVAAAEGDGARLRRARSLLAKASSRSVAELALYLGGAPRRRRNRRRLAALTYRADDHAVLNDEAHDFSLLHYYIGLREQVRQLESLGLELVECLDPQGRPVSEADTTSSWLHYVCRSAQTPQLRSDPCR